MRPGPACKHLKEKNKLMLVDEVLKTISGIVDYCCAYLCFLVWVTIECRP